MSKKGLELSMSTIIWILVLLVFLLIVIGLYANWQSSGFRIVDKIFSFFP